MQARRDSKRRLIEIDAAGEIRPQEAGCPIAALRVRVGLMDALDRETCWAAVCARDRQWDGRLLFGVSTTGVYCRPSCPARRPLRRNVRFYLTPEEAEADGLRACLRCRPREGVEGSVRAEQIARLCAYIDSHLDGRLSLADLSARLDLSPFHFQRIFKAALGVTPRQYIAARRTSAFKANLRTGAGVTEAIYEAGYGSSSRAYERAGARLGMTPGEYRSGGRRVSIAYASAPTPVGLAMVGATGRGVCFLQFGASHGELLDMLAREYPRAALTPVPEPHPEEFRQWMDALRRHLDGGQARLELPLDLRATGFQLQVWECLQSIPYGSVRSYGEIAAALGRPTAARAVARACAANRVAIAIPCHRAVRGTGEPGGYRWDPVRKRTLIERERTVAQV
jgi:AraC family transcriptional regulator, regulatory protein of adaptative response / methylated-DNA-[protein]-cysteine methyltransferase